MRNSKKTVRLLSVVMSLLMVLSVISFPTLKSKAAGGVDGFVERCYTVTLDRGSDPAGFAAWKDMLLNGKSVGVYIAYGFMFSDEYVAKNKDNRAFVKDLYTLFLDREPDEDGYNLWVGLLEGGKSREEIFAGFANSTEFYGICESYGITAGFYDARYDIFQINDVNLFVERMYQTCLGRRGDMDGHILWVSKLLNKELTGVECAKNFIKSDEYVSKNLSNDEYVENLYKAFMGRASDAEGKSLWLNALNTGTMTRDEVFAGFANSKEFGDICASYNIVKGSYTATDIADKNGNNNNQNNNNNNNNNTNNYNKPDINVGDVVKFGKYEQDGDITNGKEDIEWEVLSVKDDGIMLISKYILDCQMFHEEENLDTVTWEDCSLRKWLNNEFYNTAFDDNEKKQVASVTVDNSKSPYHSKDTVDKVFCLSIEEVQEFYGYQSAIKNTDFGYNQRLICAPTKYAVSRGTRYYIITEEDYNDSQNGLKKKGYTEDVIGLYGWYWSLRSDGNYGHSYYCVSSDGLAGQIIGGSFNEEDGVRPTIYLNYYDDLFFVSEEKEYTEKEEVAFYIHTFAHLPSNYITKDKAKELGWVSEETSLSDVAPGKSIGGDIFYNREGILEESDGRTYYECDIDYSSGTRNALRIVYSNDGLIYYTNDHYNSFEFLYSDFRYKEIKNYYVEDSYEEHN